MSILKNILIARFELEFDGVLPLDEAEAAEWKVKRDRAQAIVRRNATYSHPVQRAKGGRKVATSINHN